MEDEEFLKLVKSVKQAGKIKNGKQKAKRTFLYKKPDIKLIRKHLHVSQSEFALMIGVSTSTVQNWEQGRREPEGPAKALLRVAEKNPKALFEALHVA